MLNSYDPTLVLAPVEAVVINDLPTLVGPIRVTRPAPSLGSENGSVLPPFPPEDASRSVISRDSRDLS